MAHHNAGFIPWLKKFRPMKNRLLGDDAALLF